REILAPPLCELALVIPLAQPLPVRLDHGLPRIAFLTAHELVAVVAIVIGRSAILPIVEVIRHEMAVDPVLEKEFGEGVVEGLERPPAAVQESEAPGQHVAPGGHAGEAPDVVALECGGARCEPVEVRRRDARTAVGTEDVPVE